MHVLNRILAEHYGHKKMVSEKGIKNIIHFLKYLHKPGKLSENIHYMLSSNYF